MRQTQKTLTWLLWAHVAICAVIALLFETNLLANGVLADETQVLFVMAIVMQLLTICVIPLALRLFKFKYVNRQLVDGTNEERATHLRKWGVGRLAMLCLPMVLNMLFYYITMVVGFCYMAIILMLSLFFIYPSMERCRQECGVTATEKDL